MATRTRQDLQILQALPLELKIQMTLRRIHDYIEYFGQDRVYLAWSGGKDSTVLRHLMMQYWPNIECVFVNTGLEFPEIQLFINEAKNRGENVTVLRPKLRFDEVIRKYGYPLISKEIANTIYEARRALALGKTDTIRIQKINGTIDAKKRDGKKTMYDFSKYKPLLDVDFIISDKCCYWMKKSPSKSYAKSKNKVSIVATMAEESALRSTQWIKQGCTSFDESNPFLKPISFWTEQDVLQYIYENNVRIPSVYGEVVPRSRGYETTGLNRTGCIFCGFGAHLEKGETRFEKLKVTHPKQYAYCIEGGGYDIDGLWKPNKEGLGMGHVFDVLNRIYGNDFIRY